MAKPPKKPDAPKPPALPGLGLPPAKTPSIGLPGLSAPARPSGLDLTLKVDSAAQVKVAITNLARRIANSSKHVVMLEAHNASVMQALATNVEAAGILKAAGYGGIYFEVDARTMRASGANAVFPKTLKRLSEKPKSGAASTVQAARAALSAAFSQATNEVLLKETPLPVYKVGDEYITAEEALQATRTALGRTPLLIEQEYIAGVKAQRQKTFQRIAKEPKLADELKKAVAMLDETLATAEGYSFPSALMDLMKFVTYMPVDEAEKKDFIKSLARELSNPANAKHVEELELLFNNLDRLRTEGDSDKHLARNGLAHAQGANTLFVAGAGHGMSNIPSSLPSQIAQQAGVAESDVQVLLPVVANQAAGFHAELVKLKLAGKLRDDLIIFHMEEGKDYKVGEWLEKAKSLYAGQNIPDFKPAP